MARPFSVSTKRFLLLLTLLLLVLLAGCKVAPEGQPSESTPQLPQPKTLTDTTWIALDKAIQQAVSGREDVLAFLLYRVTIDHVEYSADGNLALVWTALVDKNTGLVQSAEPGLVIAHRTADSQWSVTFQVDTNFAAELQAVPETLLSADEKTQYMPAVQQSGKDGTVYTGYRLPWTNGQRKYLTGSIGHVLTYKSCPTTCLYAFDFADGTMFPIAAAKAGTVKLAVWKYENGNTTNANYLVLEDTTTTPTTYMVYYHLAQNSIPAALRVVGAKVYQGQYLANADDTGASTGNHLHFMVHTNATSYWGTSVDIVFDEVTVNGGRPRTCVEAQTYPDYGSQCMPGNLYTSRNGDSAIPTGAITAPITYSTITTPTVTVSGWLNDDTAVASGQLMYTVSGDWKPIGPVLTDKSFSTEINLCDAGIPDGKFFLSLVVIDQAGKTSADNTGLTELEKSVTCPALPPVCTPADNQAALYSETDFQGQCQLLDIGEYADLDALSNVKSNQARSVQVGSGVSLLLYTEANFAGTQELFQSSDASLADNLSGDQNASSAKVVNHLAVPDAAVLTLPEGATSEDAITLPWSVAEGIETKAELTGPNSYTSSLDWQSDTTWPVGLLAAGDYTFSVTARNLVGTTTVTEEFTVSEPVALPVAVLDSLPEQSNTTAIQLTWTVSSGADITDHFEIQWCADGGDWQTWSNQPEASARAAVFSAEMGKKYEFRIRAVEANGKTADFSADATAWTVVNAYCQEDKYEGAAPGDDEIASAAPMVTSQTYEHNWCPVGDIDWAAIQVTEGQVLRISTTPSGLNSAAIIQLYDTDGTTMLGESHPVDANSGAALDWTVPADGVYSIKMTPVDSAIGGNEAAYSVSVEVQSTVQPSTLICGSITIPALLGAGLAAAKSISAKKKKTSKRAGWK